MAPMPWFERRFNFDLPVGAFPAVLERLRGTPARAAALVAGVPEALLSVRRDGNWSAKEHIGHLADLHSLDETRVREFVAGAESLSAADVENRKTEAAGHNQTAIAELLENLRGPRVQLVEQMESLGEEEVGRRAMHPRLQQRMRLLDWAYFVAEHDDHHLAHVRRIVVMSSGLKAKLSG